MLIKVFNKEFKINRDTIIGILLFMIIICVVGIYILTNGDEIVLEKAKPITNDTVITTSALVTTDTAIKQDEIKIYIVGAVKNEGIYTLKKGQFIYDVVKMAGDFTSEADKENINMVYELKENVMIKIKKKSEINKTPIILSQENNDFKGMEIIKNSGGSVVGENSNGSKGGKININSANENDLKTLPGVGESTAKKILAFRERTGGFKKIEDIKNVSGIGDAKYNAMKDFIIVN